MARDRPIKNEKLVYFILQAHMSTALHHRSIPSPRKRNSAHFALHPSNKRLKAGDSLDAAGPSHLSPAVTGDRAGHFQAERWFEDTDKNASRDVSFSDNDPPFYINRRSLSDGSSVCAVRSDGTSVKHSTLGKPTAPTRALLARMESCETNSKDFRSVIDDLTIQNKKLKKKLRLYERLHCSHLQDDKMFEVRVHGLAAHRKWELEETLRGFATSVEETSPERPTINPTPIESLVAGSAPITRLQKAAVGAIPTNKSLSALGKLSCASTTCSKPVDSAYASMSGQTGTSQLPPQDSANLDSINRASQRHQSVKSYLHDIPKTIVLKQSMAMSEKSKSKLVVKRLEQIFTGKGAASRRHTQSYQQQEVSHSAAQADRLKFGTQGRERQSVREGVREARISEDVHLLVDSLSEAKLAAQQSRPSSNDRRASIRGTQMSRDSSPGQRPTRPLDLDLHRAQIPEENIHYIRHLGLSSPTGNTSPDADDGWVYLNLLTSMAQLHTMNVTPEFIRNAVADVSSRFELSSDSTKVRWLGGTESTRQSFDSDDSSDLESIKSTEPLHSANKRGSFPKVSSDVDAMDHQEPNTALPVPLYESSTDQGASTKRVPVFLAQANNGADFNYKPLFFHAVPSDQDEDSGLATDSGVSSEVIENATGMQSGINSGSYGLRETEVKLRKQNIENGLIIFYHKARFCTDLSGDLSGGQFGETAYHRYNEDPIGCHLEERDYSRDGTQDDLVDTMDLDSDSINAASSDLDLDDLKCCISDSLSSPSSAISAPIPLEVYGLGGIQPYDNFIVKVQVRHRDNKMAMSFTSRKQALQPPSRLSHSETNEMRRSHPIQVPVISEIVSTVTTQLKPATLPLPLRFRSPFSSSGSEEEDDEESGAAIHYDSKSRSSREARPVNFFAESPSEKNTESSYASTSTGSDDDSSIDLLAHARELDPDAVAAREREFDINLLPAGSVAATAGQSSSGLVKPIHQADSDVDSMSVDEDGISRMGDSD